MKKIQSALMVCFLILILSGCAFDIVRLKQIPAQLNADSSTNDIHRLTKEATIDLDTGYSRTLKKGTRWIYVGVISQGNVFKTGDQILTVEGSNIHEAYIVINSGKLVGFYLPIEKAYSPLEKPVELSFKKSDVNP